MLEGRITKIISNQFTVCSNGVEYICNARGKFRNDNIIPVVGDYCDFDEEKKYIFEIKPRKNELIRPPIANIDMALVVTSIKSPEISLSLLDKMLTIISLENIEPIICFTKLDLMNNKKDKEQLKKIIKYYKSIGIKVVNNKNLFILKRTIKNKLIVLAGQTGAGKSSILNKLNPKLNLKTNPISTSLGRGVHTTRCVELFTFGKCFIADTPGFSAIDLKGISKQNIKDTFIEFKKYNCPYKDCSHIEENDCVVKKAVEDNEILSSRYNNYKSFIREAQK